MKHKAKLFTNVILPISVFIGLSLSVVAFGLKGDLPVTNAYQYASINFNKFG